jgi:hypothetical protein
LRAAAPATEPARRSRARQRWERGTFARCTGSTRTRRWRCRCSRSGSACRRTSDPARRRRCSRAGPPDRHHRRGRRAPRLRCRCRRRQNRCRKPGYSHPRRSYHPGLRRRRGHQCRRSRRRRRGRYHPGRYHPGRYHPGRCRPPRCRSPADRPGRLRPRRPVRWSRCRPGPRRLSMMSSCRQLRSRRRRPMPNPGLLACRHPAATRGPQPAPDKGPGSGGDSQNPDGCLSKCDRFGVRTNHISAGRPEPARKGGRALSAIATVVLLAGPHLGGSSRDHVGPPMWQAALCGVRDSRLTSSCC